MFEIKAFIITLILFGFLPFIWFLSALSNKMFEGTKTLSQYFMLEVITSLENLGKMLKS